MPVLPVAHFTWQVLRTIKRSSQAPTGRALRLVPNRRTKDGTFLTELVDQGLLNRVAGGAGDPFQATYALTERGEYAAEYGECDMPVKARTIEAAAPGRAKALKKSKGVRRGGK